MRRKDLSKLFSWSMYFLSFIPLWIIVLLVDVKSLLEGTDHKYTEIMSIVIIPCGVFFSMIIQKKEFGIRDGVSDKYIILGAEECKTMTTDYLIANVIPLIAFDFAQWYEVLKFIIIFLVIGCLCITHNIFNVNILMALMKYKQYDCRLVNEDNIEISRRVISKNALTMKKGNWISVRQINNEYYLE